jgi:hypothetical protein
MSFGITKTLPQKEGPQAVDELYSVTGEYEFHMAGKPSKLKEGDYVYTIWQDEIIGRLPIIRLEVAPPGGAVNPDSGKPRTLIYVRTPGEKLPQPIPRTGHRGTRYYDGAEWPG